LTFLQVVKNGLPR